MNRMKQSLRFFLCAVVLSFVLANFAACHLSENQTKTSDPQTDVESEGKNKTVQTEPETFVFRFQRSGETVLEEVTLIPPDETEIAAFEAWSRENLSKELDGKEAVYLLRGHFEASKEDWEVISVFWRVQTDDRSHLSRVSDLLRRVSDSECFAAAFNETEKTITLEESEINAANKVR